MEGSCENDNIVLSLRLYSVDIYIRSYLDAFTRTSNYLFTRIKMPGRTNDQLKKNLVIVGQIVMNCRWEFRITEVKQVLLTTWFDIDL